MPDRRNGPGRKAPHELKFHNLGDLTPEIGNQACQSGIPAAGNVSLEVPLPPGGATMGEGLWFRTYPVSRFARVLRPIHWSSPTPPCKKADHETTGKSRAITEIRPRGL